MELHEVRYLKSEEFEKYIRVYWFKSKPLTKKDKIFLNNLPEYISFRNRNRSILSFWSTGNSSKNSLEMFGEFFEVKIIGSSNKGIKIHIQNFKTSYSMRTREQEEVDEVMESIFFGKCDMTKFEENPKHKLGLYFHQRLLRYRNGELN